MMKAKFQLAMAALLPMCVWSVEMPRVKYVAFGWDTLDQSPREMLANAEGLEKSGVDGIVISVKKSLPSGVKFGFDTFMNDPLWDRKALADDVSDCQRLAARGVLRENFLMSWWQPVTRVSWRDDAAWARIAANAATTAWLAREGKMKGLFVDNEDYRRQKQYTALDEDGDYDAAAQLARRRGAQVGAAIFREYPDITILAFWLFSQVPEYLTSPDPLTLARIKGDLWPYFLNGIFDVMPPTARLVDGNENAYRFRADKGDFYKGATRHRSGGMRCTLPENREKYRCQVLTGTGLYMDSYVVDSKSYWYMEPKDGSRLGHFRQNLDQATEAADAYVWLYGEKFCWTRWHGLRAPRFEDKPTWEEALPGLAKMLEAVRNKAKFPTFLREMKSPAAFVDAQYPQDRAGNLFDETAYTTWKEDAKDAGRFFALTNGAHQIVIGKDGFRKSACLMYGRKVKPGEIYAVWTSLKGPAATARVYWRRNKVFDFNLADYPLRALPAAADGWQKARALVVVPEGSDELILMLSSSSHTGARLEYREAKLFKVK